MEEVNFVVRWGHLVFGITWVGMLYYFNFVQGSYFKSASPEGLIDAKAKLAPNALWWFRWAAMLTFVTGLYLISYLGTTFKSNDYIMLGAFMGTVMFMNVWLVIWPAQRVALGMKKGNGAAAGAKALLASRTNVLFSGPMLYMMLASAHKKHLADGADTGFFVTLGIIIVLELNGLLGKQGPLSSISGVIGCSIGLTASLAAILHFV